MKLQEISIEITQQCPNNCIHCSSYSSWDKSQTLPFEIICSVVSEAIVLGAKTICLSGGEPFLHPRLIEIVDHINASGAKCVIYSSGIYYDGRRYQSLPEDILLKIKDYTEKIIFNYEASDSKTYDIIMGTKFGGYNLMRQSIISAVEMGLQVEAHVVPMKINHMQIPDIIQQCNELGVSKVSFLRMVRHGRVLDNKTITYLSENEEQNVKDAVKQCTKDKSISIRFGIPFADCVRRVNCKTGINKLNIRYDGLVYPCEAFKNNLPSGFTKAMPDSVCQYPLTKIYNESQYLLEIREKLEAYQQLNTCESCMNQYYTKMERK